MPEQLHERLQLLKEGGSYQLLTDIQRGIEKESLRITPTGKLAQTSHPVSLGSPLTHPHITTDFSEALLEFITPVSDSIEHSLEWLDRIHRYVYSQLNDEELWVTSMPCLLEGDDNIPVAQYGHSNVARMKTVYRKGLGHRYGRLMQTISGIHYNFSVPDSLWPLLQQQDGDNDSLQNYKTKAYFGLIRNFRRYSWLLIYLFGASPAICKSFLNGRTVDYLEPMDYGTMHLPYGTSLRMGDLGYQSNAQASLKVCYNGLDSYIETLRQAITNAHPAYEKIGMEVDGDYRQLSTSLLQIENEFYSPIRPKRVTESGEIPLGALKDRGVEYIEVRCIDVNPFLPLGIDAEQIRFIDSFLLFCLFNESPLCDEEDYRLMDENLKAVVNCGRNPELHLQTVTGSCSLKDWADSLMDRIESIALQLDQANGGEGYQRACYQQRQKINDAALTPSAKVLTCLHEQSSPFFRFAMDQAQQLGESFRQRPLPSADQLYFEELAKQSLLRQQQIEQEDVLSFEDYLSQYYRQYQELL